MRLREEQLVRALIRNLAEGRVLDDDALTDAGMTVFRFGNMGDAAARKHALERAQRCLMNPDVQARFADLFEINGFSINDAIVAQITFIQHGNYRALQDYFRMTQPSPVQAHVHTHIDGSQFTSREPRAIVARVLGQLKNGEHAGETFEQTEEAAPHGQTHDDGDPRDDERDDRGSSTERNDRAGAHDPG